MAELKGTFYGVSVGPGDPELMTLQAVRLIRQCPVLAAPQTASGQMLALDIARRALGSELDGKTILPFCTHEGSGLSGTEKDIQRAAKGALVARGLSIYGSSVDQAKPALEKWSKKD